MFLSSLPSPAIEPTPQQLEFFETKIRPLFAEHCYTCHSETAEKLKGGLRLDIPEALLKGGDSGPAVIAGDPDASLLIKAVRYTDPDLQMPPKNKKLPTQEIADLEAWVKMGAPLPPSPLAAARHPLTDVNEARARHWAFQPVSQPALPAVKLSRWVQTPIDNFILAEMEKRNLTPAPVADRRTLIRRVTYDLIGLPPTYEEVEAFIKDQRPDAYARLVERLLASPHYGERWGRYWLDVARYADAAGFLSGGLEQRYPFSYTYRDYVIRAFNEDKPYDQFLLEQIAADLLQGPQVSTSDRYLAGKDAGAPSQDKRVLAALGFLTVGRRFNNNENDIIDDRIDVVARGTLGLTVACARCHDHKFDPIPSTDYYAMHGVFASTEEPSELPLLGEFHDSPEYQDYLIQKAKIEKEITDFTANAVANFKAKLRQHVGDYLLGARDAALLADPSKFDTFAGERQLNPKVLRRWINELEARRKAPDPIFGPWFQLATGQHSSTPILQYSVDRLPDTPFNSVVARALADQVTNSLRQASQAYNKIFSDVDAEWTVNVELARKQAQNAATELPDPEHEALRQVLFARGAPVNVPKEEAETILARLLSDRLAPISNKIVALNWMHPGAPPRVMALRDSSHPADSHLFKRGNPNNPGEEVPRRFLTVLGGRERPAFTNGSGRLELARAIATRDNPLTARVYVNRVWLHHFGEGLVTTPGDFGVRTEPPIQRSLLDYLAATFIENGWSTKNLHRLILLSAVYQQSSDASPASLKADPDNRLLTRMNRQRLDFEATRDTFLALGGNLDHRLGGIPVELDTDLNRRTIYGLIDRQNLATIFRTFDFANPDTSSQGRFHTTVPQQALFLMNSPFIIEQARCLAKRAEARPESCPAEKVRALYRLVLQRPATPSEVELGERFLANPQSATNLSALEKYAQVLLLSNEVIFLD